MDAENTKISWERRLPAREFTRGATGRLEAGAPRRTRSRCERVASQRESLHLLRALPRPSNLQIHDNENGGPVYAG